MTTKAIGFTALLLLSCSKDNAKAPDAPAAHDAKVVDAKPLVDAGPDAPPDATTAVLTVVCPTTPDAVVMTGADVYTPMMTTITVGQIVKFVMPGFHNVTPNTGQDPGEHVDFGKTECKQFTTAGTFTFQCSLHHFMGSVVVN